MDDFQQYIDVAVGPYLPKHDRDEDLEFFEEVTANIINKAVYKRMQKGDDSLALYEHASNLELSPYLPQDLKNILANGNLSLEVLKPKDIWVKVAVPWDTFPEGIISKVLSGSSICGRFVLALHGLDEWLLSSRPITQYKIIRKWIREHKIPKLVLLPKKKLYNTLNRMAFTPPTTKKRKRESESSSLWSSLVIGTLRVHIRQILTTGQRESRYFVHVHVQHGTQCLAEVVTEPKPRDPMFDCWVDLNVNLQQLPRAARLCVIVHKEMKRKNTKRKTNQIIGSGSLSIFNFEGKLRDRNYFITLFPMTPAKRYTEKISSTANPLEAQIEVEFEHKCDKDLFYPEDSQVVEYGKFITKLDSREEKQLSEKQLKKLRKICEMNSRVELTEEEKQLLWKGRKECLQYPDILPTLLQAVDWSSRDNVSQLYVLLADWPLVSVESALEMLRCTSVDAKVREHAVISLSKALPDERLAQYLLQLTFALKHEPYVDSKLLHFLLHKSLTNKHFGHLFFWYLRSEKDNWPGNGRIEAILTAYCKGLGKDVKKLASVVSVVVAITELAEKVKSDKKLNSKERTKRLQAILKEDSWRTRLCYIESPIKPNLRLGSLRFEECRVLDSARRPLLLVWNHLHEDAPLPPHAVIFKSHDDLRQDMLSLQAIDLMSQVWMQERLDLCMTPYTCLPTGHRAGLIEVVPNAKTVFKVQSQARLGAMQVDSSQLLKWIKEHNPPPKFTTAVDNFRRSCAGYSVATYVLGIGDRHPDNIMLTKSGQLFHIDFGHFLGNYKKKLGIQRERVPFVLTSDFMKVILSESEENSLSLAQFEELCEQSYLVLRKHSNLLLSIFTLLVSAGIPELQSLIDVDFLKTRLGVGLSDEEALASFKSSFAQANHGSWHTKLDWLFHSIAH